MAMPSGTTTATTLALGHEANDAYESFDWTAQKGLLHAGENPLQHPVAGRPAVPAERQRNAGGSREEGRIGDHEVEALTGYGAEEVAFDDAHVVVAAHADVEAGDRSREGVELDRNDLPAGCEHAQQASAGAEVERPSQRSAPTTNWRKERLNRYRRRIRGGRRRHGQGRHQEMPLKKRDHAPRTAQIVPGPLKQSRRNELSDRLLVEGLRQRCRGQRLPQAPQPHQGCSQLVEPRERLGRLELLPEGRHDVRPGSAIEHLTRPARRAPSSAPSMPDP